MTYSDYPKQKRDSGDNTIWGLILLAPLLLVLLIMQFRPAIDTVLMSTERLNFLTGANSFVGSENYSRILSNPDTGNALKYTFFVMMTRVAVLLFVPAIIGMIVGIQGKIGRILNRFLLGFLAAFIAPVALILLWRVFWGQFWGREPSPLGRDLLEIMMPASPEGALRSTLLLDAITTMAIAVVVGAIVYIAVLRGRETHRSNVMKVGMSVWIIGLIYAVGSALNAFLIPFILTGGGPAGRTRSLMILSWERGIRSLQFGVGATQSVLLMIPIVLGVIIVWALITMFRIRLVAIPNNQTQAQSNALSFLSIPIIALIFLPITGLLLWGHFIAVTEDGFSNAFRILNLKQSLLPIMIPILVIWLVQIPITYLAGAGLGLMRPINRTVTNIIFLALLILAFLPPEVLLFAWYKIAADLSIINTKIVLAIPWFVSGISLIVFKLFFDGMYGEVQNARENHQPTDVILQKIIVSSLPIVALVGLVLTFMSIQSFLWSLTAINSEKLRPTTIALYVSMVQDFTQNASSVGAAVIFVDLFVIPFGLAFGLLSGFGLEKYALVGGDADEQPEQPTAFSDPYFYAAPPATIDDDDLGLDDDISATSDDDDLGLDDDDLDL